MRERNPELHRQRVSASLIGNHRRWLGDKAGYVAVHIWMVKHLGKASHCSFNPTHKAKRFEWANKYHSVSRNIEDYIQLCPSCHRIFDSQGKCRKGHEYTPETTYVNNRGHRRCLICKRERKLNATTNKVSGMGHSIQSINT